MIEYWRDVDYALIAEASKVQPDFAKMEQLVREGADVNAWSRDYDENALSDIIEGWTCGDSERVREVEKDSLPQVVKFFLSNGFDPSREDGRAGALCLTNLMWSRCEGTMIPTMKLLLDAGCQNVPPWRDEPNSQTPMELIGEEAYYQQIEGEFEYANTLAALTAMIFAREQGRQYSRIERYSFSLGHVVCRVLLTMPNRREPFFTLNESTSKHDNCFDGSLYFELDNGCLVSKDSVLQYFDSAEPHEEVVDVTKTFARIIGSKLMNMTFDSQAIVRSTMHYGQQITRFSFDNGETLVTQTNSGEVPKAKSLAYFMFAAE